MATISKPDWSGRTKPLVIVTHWLSSSWASGQRTSAHSHQQPQWFYSRSCLFPPDKQRRQQSREKQSSLKPSVVLLELIDDDPGLTVPADRGVLADTQLEKQHSRQAMTLAERCTSVTGNKRGAWIIRGDTVARGMTPSPTLKHFLM